VVSKRHIRFKGKAQADRESAAYVEYVSSYRRPATQPLDLGWGFETTSYQIAQVGVKLILLDKITKNDINNRFKRGRDDTRLY
jgi:hypothetical protein